MNFLAFADGPLTLIEALSTSVTGFVVVLIVLAVLAVLVLLLSKAVQLFVKNNNKEPKKQKKQTPQPTVAPVVTATPTVSETALPDNQSAGSLDLVNTDEKTAAVIMAIVSNESGIPLNRLNFKSIKLIEE